MTNPTGHPPMSNVTEARRQKMLEISRALNAVRSAIWELRSHVIHFRADDLRRGNAPWTVELYGETAKMDDEDFTDGSDGVFQLDPIAQWIDGQCKLSERVDKTKDPEAKQILRDTMQEVKWLISPPRGQVVEIKK